MKLQWLNTDVLMCGSGIYLQDHLASLGQSELEQTTCKGWPLGCSHHTELFYNVLKTGGS